jgi:transglutaminase-like putative cysteine protease
MHAFRYFFIITSMVCALLSISLVAEARWATEDDLDVTTELFNQDIIINKDGTYTETIESMLKATKESGKDKLVSFPLVYNASNSELKIIAAKTILDGKEYPVDLKLIEDKPLASSPQGFDQNHQILIAFPQVALNASIYLKYKITVKEAAIPGFFATTFTYGSPYFLRASKAKVVSELPFHVVTSDDDKALEIKQEKLNQKYILEILLKKPIIKIAIDEQYMATDNLSVPRVSISTLQEWPALGNKILERYEAVLKQQLPDVLENIAEEAKSKVTIVEKINTITARLAENITYMGDWRTIKGAFVPRNLDEIIKTKIGDCKDFSVLTVAILRRLGFSANVALVNRGTEETREYYDLPSLTAFNHAFVYLAVEQKAFWIDPTNFTSFAQGIYPDVANRKALLLNPLNPMLLNTSALASEDSAVFVLRRITLPKEKTDTTHVTGQLSLSGILALPLVGADIRFSKETINQGILSMITDSSRLTQWNIGEYNLVSRIVSDLKFNFDFTEKHTRMKTTAGDAFLLPTKDLISKLLIKTHDRVTGLLFSEPYTYHSITLLPKTALIGKESSHCSVDSPWFKAIRVIKDTANGIQISENYVVKKDKISNTELKSSEYAQFQNEVFSCFGESAVVYKH